MDERDIKHFGACKYCGTLQLGNFSDDMPQDERDNRITEICQCSAATHERNKQKQIAAAKERVQELFGAAASLKGEVEPIKAVEVLPLMDTAIELIANQKLYAMSLEITGHTKAKISQTGKGKIAVERSESLKYREEE